jgi:hypothetical protein
MDMEEWKSKAKEVLQVGPENVLAVQWAVSR